MVFVSKSPIIVLSIFFAAAAPATSELPRPESFAVLPEWYSAYKRGNAVIPQDMLAITLFVGNAITKSLARHEVDPVSVVNSKLTGEQLEDLADTARQAHGAYAVVPSDPKTPPDFRAAHDSLSRLWGTGRDKSLEAMREFVQENTDLKANRYEEPIDRANALQEFFTNPKYKNEVEMLGGMYETAVRFIEEDEHVRDLTGKYRKSFDPRGTETPESLMRKLLDEPMRLDIDSSTSIGLERMAKLKARKNILDEIRGGLVSKVREKTRKGSTEVKGVSKFVSLATTEEGTTSTFALSGVV